MNSKLFLIFVLVFFLIGSLGFVFAEETGSGFKILEGFETISPEQFSLLQGIYLEETEETLAVRFVFEGIDFGILNFLSEFENVKPTSLSGHPTYIKINKTNEEIFEADFTVSEGSSYSFAGLNEIKVPADSRVRFFNGVAKLEVVEGTIFENFPDVLNPNYFLTGIEIEGKDIILSEDLYLIEGKVKLIKEGCLVETGSFNYKKNLIVVDPSYKNVLIANKDMGDYSGNWVYQDETDLKIKSSREGMIFLDILKNHEIFNTDNKDKLDLSIGYGDYLSIKSRKDLGLTPLVSYNNFGGMTRIYNDGLNILFDEGGYSVGIGKMPKKWEDFEKPYQSVAMEIQSDLVEDEKLIINSYRQFNILSKENKELVTFNQYGLPVSAKIEDNSLQTIGQLREKYPEMEFYSVAPHFGGENNTPPYMLSLIDEFLKENPEAKEEISVIDISMVNNAMAGEDMIRLGKIVDPYISEPSRDISSPLKILEHEHEHVKDYLIYTKEFETLKNSDDEDIQLLFEKKFQVEEEIKNIQELLKRDSLEYDELELLRYHFGDVNDLQKSLEDEIFRLQEEKYPDNAPLKQVYARVAIEAKNNFYHNEEANNLLKEVYYKREQDAFNSLKTVFQKFSPNENFGTELSEKEVLDRINDFIFKEDEFGSSFYLKMKDHAEDELVGEFLKLNNQARSFAKLTKSILTTEEEFYDSFEQIYHSNTNLEEKNKLNEIFQIGSGTKDVYAVLNAAYPSEKRIPNYAELSSTLREQTDEQIIRRLNSPKPEESKITKELVQIAFDSGKMNAEKYNRLMGEGHCKQPDCCDQKCLIYKFLCEGAC